MMLDWIRRLTARFLLKDDANTFTTKVCQLPGSPKGDLGVAGTDKPGPNVRVMAIPPWRYFLEEVILYHYVNAWLGVAALDSAGVFKDAGGSLGSIWPHFRHVSEYAVALTIPALLRELNSYLNARRKVHGGP